MAFFGKLSGAALEAVYHACDVFCLPCRRDPDGGCEGFPAVLIEAMAYGKPVVTTHHTEIPRVVEQIVVNENDPHELAQALQRVYHSATLRRELGLRSRELAEKHFSNRNVTDRLNLFRSIAAPGTSSTTPDPTMASDDRRPINDQCQPAARIPQEQLS